MDIKSYLDTIHYKIGYNIELLIKNKNHNHIIIYGPINTGKTTLIKTLFNDIFDSTKIINQPFLYEMNHKYYYFDLKKIHNKNIFIEFIQEITQSYDHFNHSKYILIDHFEIIHRKYQNILKVILEKSVLSSKFILITNKNNIIHPICSRCFSIRINEPYIIDKFIYFKDEIHLNDKLLMEKCSIEPFHKIINYHNYLITDISIHYIHEIINIINTKLTIQKIDKIRRLCENIKELDIPISKIFHDLFFNLTYSDKEYDIIKLLSYYEYLNIKSYRPLIYLETVILKLNEIIISD